MRNIFYYIHAWIKLIILQKQRDCLPIELSYCVAPIKTTNILQIQTALLSTIQEDN